MAKKSSTKSVSKKKAAPKKKKATAKTKPAAKTKTKKTTKATKKAAMKTKKATTKKTTKKTVAKKKKLTVKELVMMKFDAWKPKKQYKPPVNKDYTDGFAAPPFTKSKKIKEILKRKFDFDFEKIAKPPKKKLSIKELIMMKFDAWKPKNQYKPPVNKDYTDGFAAPPFTEDKAIKELLARKFDFDFAEEAAKAEAARKAAEEKAAREKAEAERKAAEEKAAREKAEAERKAAEEKAAKEKAEAERKAAEEKAAREKAEAERKAAEEKAAREKAEAERKAAEEKAAREKAEAERKAAEEKAAREKAEAERKAAEEKAAREKAEAERKAAEEKAAREKAEAERKAAEEKAKEEEESKMPETAPEETDPVEKLIKYSIVGLIVLFILIIAASYSNSNRYYVRPTDDGVQIWKGKFSPLGEEFVVFLKGAKGAESQKEVYTREEISKPAFIYFLNLTDKLLAEPFPPIKRIRDTLKKASLFIITEEDSNALNARVTHVDMIELIYKADAAASRLDKAGFEKALEYLRKATLLGLGEEEAKFVQKKTELIKNFMESGKPAEKANLMEGVNHVKSK